MSCVFTSSLFSQPIFSTHPSVPTRGDYTPSEILPEAALFNWWPLRRWYAPVQFQWVVIMKRYGSQPFELLKHLLVGDGHVPVFNMFGYFIPVLWWMAWNDLHNTLTFYRFSDWLMSLQVWRVNCHTVTMICSCYGHPNVCCPKGMLSKGFLHNLFVCAHRLSILITVVVVAWLCCTMREGV